MKKLLKIFKRAKTKRHPHEKHIANTLQEPHDARQTMQGAENTEHTAGKKPESEETSDAQETKQPNVATNAPHADDDAVLPELLAHIQLPWEEESAGHAKRDYIPANAPIGQVLPSGQHSSDTAPETAPNTRGESYGYVSPDYMRPDTHVGLVPGESHYSYPNTIGDTSDYLPVFSEPNSVLETPGKSPQRCSTPLYEPIGHHSAKPSSSCGSTYAEIQDQDVENLQTASPKTSHDENGKEQKSLSIAVDSAGYLKPIQKKQRIGKRTKAFFGNLGRTITSAFIKKKKSSKKPNLFDSLIPEAIGTNATDTFETPSEKHAGDLYYVQPSSPTHSSNDFSHIETSQSYVASGNAKHRSLTSDASKNPMETYEDITTRQAQSTEDNITIAIVQTHPNGREEHIYSTPRSMITPRGSHIERAFEETESRTTNKIPSRHYTASLDAASPLISSLADPNSAETALTGRKHRATDNPHSVTISAQHSSEVEHTAEVCGISNDHVHHHKTNTHKPRNTMKDTKPIPSFLHGKKKEQATQNTTTSQTRPEAKKRVSKLSTQLLDSIRNVTSKESPSKKKSATQETTKAKSQASPRQRVGKLSIQLLDSIRNVTSKESPNKEEPSEGKKYRTKVRSNSPKAVAAFQKLLGKSPVKVPKIEIPAAIETPSVASPPTIQTPVIITQTEESTYASRAPNLADILEGRRNLRSSTTSTSSSCKEAPIYARSTKSSSSHKGSTSSAADIEDIAPELPPRPFFDLMHATKKTSSSFEATREVFLDTGSQAARPTTPEATIPSTTKIATVAKSTSTLPSIKRAPMAVKPPMVPKLPPKTATLDSNRKKASTFNDGTAVPAMNVAMPGRTDMERPVDSVRTPVAAQAPYQTSVLTSDAVRPSVSSGNTSLASPVSAPKTKASPRSSATTRRSVTFAPTLEEVITPPKVQQSSKQTIPIRSTSPRNQTTPKRTRSSPMDTVDSQPSTPSQSNFTTSSTPFRTRPIVWPPVAPTPCTPYRSPSPSPLDTSPPKSVTPTYSDEEVDTLNSVKNATKTRKSTSPQIRQQIKRLLNNGESKPESKTIADLPTFSTKAHVKNLTKKFAADSAKNAPSTPLVRTSEAVNSEVIRKARDIIEADGHLTNSPTVSELKSFYTPSDTEKRPLPTRKNVSSARNLESTLNDNLSTPSFVERVSPGSSSRLSGSRVQALASRFSTPKGPKVSDLVKKFEGKPDVSIAAEPAQQQRSR